MIRVTFYRNGFTINGHAHPQICGEVSALAWASSNSIYHIDRSCTYYTSANDGRPEVGYTHSTFCPDNEVARWLNRMLKKNLDRWGSEFGWFAGGHVSITEIDEDLHIPPNFRELHGIA